MSGGRYGDICCCEPEELLQGHRIRQLEEIAQSLVDLGHLGVAIDMQLLINSCKFARSDIALRFEQLENVMQAVEWFDSGDYTIEQVNAAVDEYSNQLVKNATALARKSGKNGIVLERWSEIASHGEQ